jgi:hypothetical protein
VAIPSTGGVGTAGTRSSIAAVPLAELSNSAVDRAALFELSSNEVRPQSPSVREGVMAACPCEAGLAGWEAAGS